MRRTDHTPPAREPQLGSRIAGYSPPWNSEQVDLVVSSQRTWQ